MPQLAAPKSQQIETTSGRTAAEWTPAAVAFKYLITHSQSVRLGLPLWPGLSSSVNYGCLNGVRIHSGVYIAYRHYGRSLPDDPGP